MSPQQDIKTTTRLRNIQVVQCFHTHTHTRTHI